jgi:hypothetical protein
VEELKNSGRVGRKSKRVNVSGIERGFIDQNDA